jgi:hypothetical protein
MRNLLFVMILALFVLPFAYGADEEFEKTPQGYQIAKDNYLNIPSDMKVQHVANNVFKPEEDADYLSRKIEEQNLQITQLKSQINDLDARVKKLETR